MFSGDVADCFLLLLEHLSPLRHSFNRYKPQASDPRTSLSITKRQSNLLFVSLCNRIYSAAYMYEIYHNKKIKDKSSEIREHICYRLAKKK